MDVMALDASHAWKATPGYRILLVDSGAIRFDFPIGWIVHRGTKQVLLLDRYPPDERSYIGLRWRRILPAEATIPLEVLVSKSSIAEQRPIVSRGPVIRLFRPPLEAAWIQLQVIDRGRQMCTRMCVARGGCTQAIILAEFHSADEVKFFPIWETFLKTLAVGDYIVDATTGRRYEQRG
jgi:hypothetical protein